MLKWSLTGPNKNLHVKTGVLKMSEVTTALQIWANNLFFIDLFQSDTAKSKSQAHMWWQYVLIEKKVANKTEPKFIEYDL